MKGEDFGGPETSLRKFVHQNTAVL